MIIPAQERVCLTSRAAWIRGVAVTAMVFGGLGLRSSNPNTWSWLPIHPSCGAVTGLPCIFCGTTRALHCLLNGDFARALYFNWLAFVVAGVGLMLALLFLMEIFVRRRLWRWPRFEFTPRLAAFCAAGLVALWLFQVTLAISLHKHELLNPRGPLYALFVK